MSKLRSYQRKLKEDVYAAWQGGANVVMGVLPTGGGKTVVIGDIAREHQGNGVVMAHRSELVGQISQALAREEIRHRVLAPDSVIKQIQNAHLEEFGRTWVDPRARWAAASVQSMRSKQVKAWLEHIGGADKVGLCVEDEGHHVLRENTWGKAFRMFPKARGLFVTATPVRADGKGLGSHADGLADVLVEGPQMRELIDLGFLTDYDVLAPQTDDLDLEGVHITAGGELNMDEVGAAMAKSRHIVGDVVKHYLQHARGKLGITFAANIAEAQKITDAFNAAGVPAALVTADSTPDERRLTLRKFRARQLLQLVNVDLFGEGFDLPAVEVVSFARPTASFSLYCQQWGRALRLMISPILMAAWDTYEPWQRLQLIAQSDKPKALIIDHVGNLLRFRGPPDKPQVWSLDAKRRSNAPDDSIPLTSCPTCAHAYLRSKPKCPRCNTEVQVDPAVRSSPTKVDGDLFLYTPEALAAMRNDVKRVDGPAFAPANLRGTPAEARIIRTHNERLCAQHNLRHVIGFWAGMHHGTDERELYRLFFHTFKIQFMDALVLNAKEADELRAKLEAKLALAGVVIYGLPFPASTTGGIAA